MKRLFDIVVSLFLIMILLPFMLLIGLIIPITSRGSPVFRQERIGKRGKPFL
ncbi:MAG: sugar transferase, partial [Bacteroidetes bacterium]|nr:sugar transferase [Bacteroidota bacterium]